jgi:hypothetical protein
MRYMRPTCTRRHFRGIALYVQPTTETNSLVHWTQVRLSRGRHSGRYRLQSITAWVQVRISSRFTVLRHHLNTQEYFIGRLQYATKPRDGEFIDAEVEFSHITFDASMTFFHVVCHDRNSLITATIRLPGPVLLPPYFVPA